MTPFAAVVIVTSAAETTLQGALTGGSYLINDWHMDTFDLKWPKTDATFYTDGWRCRIVWRQSGGMGGRIDNNQQCKKRVADSLSGAPYLLAALQARGHSNLATEIEDLAATTAAVLPAQNAVTPSVAVQPEQNPTPVKLQKKAKVAAPKKPQKPAAPARMARKEPTDGARLTSWLEALTGSSKWQQATVRRGKAWQTIAEDETQTLALKAPAAKGKQEWVLKLTWSEKKRKAEYVVAENLRGLLSYLSENKQYRSAAFIDNLLNACEAMDHAELVTAATAWRSQTDANRLH